MAKKEDIQRLNQKITKLQSNLFDLYRERQQLFTGEKNYSTALRAATSIATGSAESWYGQLKTEWEAREVKVPARSQLTKRIKSALVVREQLAQEYGVSPDVFTLVLIPPTKVYGTKDIDHDRLMQTHVRYLDQFDDIRPHTKKDDTWRLLTVYDGLEGLDLGTAEAILASKSYLVNGLDTRALGIREYQVYALRHTGSRDTMWNWLLKDNLTEPWSVAFMGGAYHFAQDDAAGLHGWELFRPAVEIN